MYENKYYILFSYTYNMLLKLNKIDNDLLVNGILNDIDKYIVDFFNENKYLLSDDVYNYFDEVFYVIDIYYNGEFKSCELYSNSKSYLKKYFFIYDKMKSSKYLDMFYKYGIPAGIEDLKEFLSINSGVIDKDDYNYLSFLLELLIELKYLIKIKKL